MLQEAKPYHEESICSQLGTAISGVDASQPLDAETVSHLNQTLERDHVILLKDQALSEAQLIKFSHYFGTPTPSLMPTFRLPDYPLISRHSNIRKDDDEPSGAMAPEFFWHSDSYLTDTPTKATLLYSLRSPNHGGETGFVNTQSFYESLDTATKNFLSQCVVLYKNIYKNRPPVAHPAVYTNPITHKKSLYINANRIVGIEGTPENEGINLVKQLYEQATAKHRQYFHQWQDGDIVIWNNHSTMHTALPTPDGEKRLLHRILINDNPR